MATQSPSANGKSTSGTVVEYDRFIEMQLRVTRSQVRNVDVAGELMVLSAGTLAYFLVVTLIDHWVIPGGLGFIGRLLSLAVFVFGAGYYFVRQIAPLLLRRINPVFAAHTIENSKPSLKNSLVNFLLFRDHQEELPPAVYRAIEEQAATNLAKVPLETAVDRSKLIKIGYVLLGVLLACAVYKIASPKDPLQSFGRVIMPWADIQAPTRVTIADVQPGNAAAFIGQKVTVSAEVRGKRDADAVKIVYSTGDGQTVDQVVEMHLPPDGYRYEAALPADSEVLQQDLKYRIEAGDATSREFRIAVVAAPTIVVESLEYKYPEYTGFLPRKVEQQGDIKAIEGTEITVHAVANQDIESASIDFDCDQRPDAPLIAMGREATIKFVLGMKRDGTPEHASYQLLYKNTAGQANLQPLHYQIDVTPDLPPAIEFTAPAKEELQVPADRVLPMQIEAKDPDFALRRVRLKVSRADKLLLDKPLLDEPWRGKFLGKFQFDPRKLGLKSGDKVEYWAVAEDNKSPQANRTETPKRRITILSPGAQAQNPDQLAQNDKPDAGKDPSKDNDHSAEDKQNSKKQGDRDPQAGKDDQRSDSNDAQDGADGKQGDKQGDQKPGDKDSDPQQKNADNREKSGDSQDKKGGAEDKGDGSQEQQTGGKSGQDNKSGQGDKSQGNDGKGSEGKSDASQGGDRQQNGGDGKSSGDKNAGQDSAGGKNGGGENQPVDKTGADDGDAFDRMLKQIQKEDANQSGQKGQNGKKGQQTKDQDDSQQGEEKGDDQSGGGEDGGQAADDQQGGEGGKPGGNGGKQGGGNSGGGTPGGAGGQSGGAGGQKNGSGDKGQQGDDGSAQGGQKPDGDGNPSERGQGNAGKDAQRGKRPPGSNDAGDPRRAEEKLKHEKGDRASDKGGAKTSDADADAGHPPSGAKPNQEKGSKQGDQSKPAGDGLSPDKSGHGNDAQGGAGTSKKPSNEQKPDVTGGDPNEDKGDSGAGHTDKGDSRSPTAQGANQPREKGKPTQETPGEEKRDEDAQSPSQSKTQSDSQGDSGGDQSGGGKPGGGQKANKPGTGGSGQNTAADQGAGHSRDAGDGDATNEAGGTKKSDHPTGKAGSEKGKGSSSQAGTGEKGGQSSEEGTSKGETVDNTRRQKVKSGPNGQGAGASGTGGAPGTDDDSPQPAGASPEDPHADEANLEYTRKATDLVLERLKHQLDKNKVDPEMLKKLGWSREDLEQFVRRWEAMQRDAKQNGPKGDTAKKELDEALRSLGLRPHTTTLKSDSARDDQSHGLKESLRTRPPSEYAEPYKRYIQGTARGNQ